jgi:hypothetical protein
MDKSNLIKVIQGSRSVMITAVLTCPVLSDQF